MTVVTRFAPSPTGRLHVGNLRAALHNWLWARKFSGTFVLRIDDTDAERSRETFVEAIRADLEWLGFDWDRAERQSQRFDRYQASFERLCFEGRIYAAYETAQELDLKRKVQLGRGLPPVYDRAALSEASPSDRTPHWRFKLDHDADIAWHDLIRGEQRFAAPLLSDPVVRRADGTWLYHLPSVIDDIDMQVTHVVRGEDHVSNTAIQLQMFAALGSSAPSFAHEALLVGSEGKLSKRLGSLDCDALRDAEIEPLALAALLARLGTSDPIEPMVSLEPLIESIDFARFGRAPARFDFHELTALSAKTLHMLPFEAVAERLPTNVTRAVWDAVHGNLTQLSQVGTWARVTEGPVEVASDEADLSFLKIAAEVARSIDWADQPWQQLVSGLKVRSDRKGKALFLPLRRALTGRDDGPEMVALLPLIGRDQTIARLQAGSARLPRLS